MFLNSSGDFNSLEMASISAFQELLLTGIG